MRLTTLTVACLLTLPLAATLAQGKGHGKEHGQAQAKDQGQGRAKGGAPNKAMSRGPRGPGSPQQLQAPTGRGNGNRANGVGRVRPEVVGIDRGRGNDKARVPGVRVESSGGEVSPTVFRTLAASDKHGQRLAGRAVAQAAKRGASADAFVFTPLANRVQVLNRSGVLLLDLDDDRPIGSWQAVTQPFRDREGAPSFCRSGAGHPVWGRQWCVDKGFGLGNDGDIRWSRIVNPENVMIRQPATTGNLARDVLLGVLGNIVFNRLATQAITLGYAEPLSGRWIGEPSGPRVLLVSSGARPVAELVDVNRDDRADVLLVASRP
jgi:hypothetical protein